MQNLADSFTAQAMIVTILLAIGWNLLRNKVLATKSIGVMILGLAIVQALSSPALVTVAALAAAAYVGWVVLRAMRKAARHRANCPRCDHTAHEWGRCQSRYCQC